MILPIILTISILTVACAGRGADVPDGPATEPVVSQSATPATPDATRDPASTVTPDITQDPATTQEPAPTSVTEGSPKERFISNFSATGSKGLYVTDRIPLSVDDVTTDLVYRFDDSIVIVHQDGQYDGNIELRAYDRVDLHEINMVTHHFPEFVYSYLLNDKYLVISGDPDRRDDIEDTTRITIYDPGLNKIQEFGLRGFGICSVRYYDEENERAVFFGGDYSSDDPGALYSYECRTGETKMLFSADSAEVPEGSYVFSIAGITLTGEKDLWIGVDTASEGYLIPSDAAVYVLDLRSFEVTKVRPRQGMITYFDSDASVIYPYFEPDGKRITVGHLGFCDEGPQIEIYDENDDLLRTIKLSDAAEVMNYLVDWKNNVIITAHDREGEQEYRSFSMDTGEVIAQCVVNAGQYYENCIEPDPEYGILLIPGLPGQDTPDTQVTSDTPDTKDTRNTQENPGISGKNDATYVLYAWDYLE